MNYAELKKHYVTDERAAVDLGLACITVKKWKQAGIPRITQLAVQTLTNGKLKADIVK